jgi:ribosomal protein S18 acetylase RimI-like enzyme
MYRIARIQPGQGQQLRDIRLESVHHNNQAFAISQTQLLGLSHDQWEHACSSAMAGQRDAIFVAWHMHSLIGCVGVRIDSSPKMRHVGFVWGMYVNPLHRGKQIGKQLIHHVIAHGAQQGLHMLKLSVTTNQDAAIALYRRVGFERYAYEPALLHIDGIDIDALHLRYVYPRK